MVATTLPDEQIQDIKEMFYKWDTDKNGDLTAEELKSGLISNGHSVSDVDVQSLMEAVSKPVPINITKFIVT